MGELRRRGRSRAGDLGMFGPRAVIALGTGASIHSTQQLRNITSKSQPKRFVCRGHVHLPNVVRSTSWASLTAAAAFASILLEPPPSLVCSRYRPPAV